MKKKEAPALEDDDEIFDLTEIIQPVKKAKAEDDIHFEDLISNANSGDGLDLDSLLGQLDDPNPEFHMPDSSSHDESEEDLDALFGDAIKKKRAQFEEGLKEEVSEAKPQVSEAKEVATKKIEEPEDFSIDLEENGPSLDSIDDIDFILNVAPETEVKAPEKSGPSLDLDAELEALLAGTEPEPVVKVKDDNVEIDLDSLDDVLKQVRDDTLQKPKVEEKALDEHEAKSAAVSVKLNLKPKKAEKAVDEQAGTDITPNILPDTKASAVKIPEQALEEEPILEDDELAGLTDDLDNLLADFADDISEDMSLVHDNPFEDEGAAVEEASEDVHISEEKTDALAEYDSLISSLDLPEQPGPLASEEEFDPALLDELDTLMNTTLLATPVSAQDELLKAQFDIDMPEEDVLSVEPISEPLQNKQTIEDKAISRMFDELHTIYEELHSLKAAFEESHTPAGKVADLPLGPGEMDNFIMDMTERFDEHARTLATFEGRLSQVESESEELRASIQLIPNSDEQVYSLSERLQAVEEATSYHELAEKVEVLEAEKKALSDKILNQEKAFTDLQGEFAKAQEKLAQVDNIESLAALAAAKVIREEIAALLAE